MSDAGPARRRLDDLVRTFRNVDGEWPTGANLVSFAIDLANAVDAHTRPDRSAILRMAGNIAPAFVAVACSLGYSPDNTRTVQKIAEDSVRIARAIMAEVDRLPDTKE